MNAIQPSESLLRSRKTTSRAVKAPKLRTHLPQTLEAAAILGINILLAGIAISTLTQLLPYQLAQRAKLQEVQAEVKQSANRVHQLREEYNRSLDPQEAKRIVEEQSNLIDPQKQKVVWIRPNSVSN